MQRHWRRLPLLMSIGAAAAIYSAAPAAQRGRAPVSPPVQVRYPDPDVGVASLAARASAQRNAAGAFKVDYDFQFTDRVAVSGVTFVHRVVEHVADEYVGDQARGR